MNTFKIAGTDLIKKTSREYTHAVVALYPDSKIRVKAFCGSHALGLKSLAAEWSRYHNYLNPVPGITYELREVSKI